MSNLNGSVLVEDTSDKLSTLGLELFESFHDLAKEKTKYRNMSMPIKGEKIKLYFHLDFLVLEKNEVAYSFKIIDGELKAYRYKHSIEIDGDVVELLQDVDNYLGSIKGVKRGVSSDTNEILD